MAWDGEQEFTREDGDTKLTLNHTQKKYLHKRMEKVLYQIAMDESKSTRDRIAAAQTLIRDIESMNDDAAEKVAELFESLKNEK